MWHLGPLYSPSLVLLETLPCSMFAERLENPTNTGKDFNWPSQHKVFLLSLASQPEKATVFCEGHFSEKSTAWNSNITMFSMYMDTPRLFMCSGSTLLWRPAHLKSLHLKRNYIIFVTSISNWTQLHNLPSSFSKSFRVSSLLLERYVICVIWATLLRNIKMF